MTVRFLVWRYERLNLPVPSGSELEKQAGKIVDDAHRIARERGKNVLSIIKELVGSMREK